jgi:hypothetical protein
MQVSDYLGIIVDMYVLGVVEALLRSRPNYGRLHHHTTRFESTVLQQAGDPCYIYTMREELHISQPNIVALRYVQAC